MRIKEAMDGHRSASQFRIRRGAKVLYEGDRNDIPAHLHDEEIQDSWYRVRGKDTPPMWEFRI